jgi:hypothetical protein
MPLILVSVKEKEQARLAWKCMPPDCRSVGRSMVEMALSEETPQKPYLVVF